MAKKATKMTTYYDLIDDILCDQAGLMLPRLSQRKRIIRLEHNLDELWRRLGEAGDRPIYRF